jgi:putative ABC transport system permease protein
VVALIVLTLGIGATTAIYSVVDAVALRGLPFDRADRLLILDETNPTGKGLTGGYVNAANFFDWRAQQTSFEDLAAFQGSGLTVFDNGEPESLRTMMVSASLMPLLRVSPRIGHLFTSANEVAGRNRVALISDSLWRRRFNADPDIVGKTFNVGQPGAENPGRDDGVWEVIGVMRAGFEFPVGRLKPIEVWVPYVPTSDEYPRGDGSSRSYNAQVLGRLKDGVTKDQAYANMAQITGALKAQYPKWFRDRWVGVTPLHESIVGKARGWMFLLLGAVAFVLLIACVNVANLMLARATARSRDISVRAALGASRWQLARALLAESLLLSTAGTLFGVVAAYWGVGVMRTALPTTLPRVNDIAINLRVLSLAAVASIVTGVFFGVLPAIQFSRPSLSTALREGGRSGNVGMARQRARTVLLVAEVALAVVLLIGAGLFVSSFVKLTRVDLGIDTAQVLTVNVYPKVDFSKEHVDADMARSARLLHEVLDRAKTIPGVDVAAIASGTPPLSTGWSRSSLTVPGRPKSDDSDDSPDQKNISPDYFRAISVPVLNGREFTAADGEPGAEPVLIINDIAADRFFKGQNPVGVTVQSNGTRRIVGVVRAVRLGGPEAPLRPEVYMPISSTRAFGGTLYVRTTRDPVALGKDVRGMIHAVLPDVIVPDAQTFQQMYDKLIVQRKFNMIVLALFGVLAVVIAAAGIYGVMAYIVEQRTQEIGVRMALGAQPGQVLRMILSGAAVLMGVGIAIGLASGWLLSKLVSAFLFQMEPHSLVVYASAAGLLVLAGLVAAFIPARRAAGVDPVTALR